MGDSDAIIPGSTIVHLGPRLKNINHKLKLLVSEQINYDAIKMSVGKAVQNPYGAAQSFMFTT